MKIKVKRLTDTAIIPQRATKGSAGYDLSADINEEIILYPHTTVKIPTGLAFEIPHGYFGAIYARSGLATKQGLRPANCAGICDEDYKGEYIVPLYNDSDEIRIITPNQRIAQVVFQPYLATVLEETEKLVTTERNDGGFGSTGT